MQSCWPSFGEEAGYTSKQPVIARSTSKEWGLSRQSGGTLRGVRLGYDPLVDDWPRVSTQGWQHFASEAVEASFLADTIGPRLDVPHQDGWDSRTCRSPASPGFSRRGSACCSSGAPGNPLPLSSSICRRVHLTLVATIAQLVRLRGSWDARGLLWRAQRQGFAERQADE